MLNMLYFNIFIKYQTYGGVAHLGERLNGIQEVVGSIPIVSTKDLTQVRSFYLSDFRHIQIQLYKLTKTD